MFENYTVPSDLIPSDPRFGVGPSLIKEEFFEDLAKTSKNFIGMSHRQPKIRNLCKNIQDGLKKYFNLPDGYEVIMGNGGATFLFDMIGLGLVKNKSYHYVTGEFSSKWFASHKNIPWIYADRKEVEYGEGINPEAISGYDMICCTLNETSTGVILTELPTVDENCLLAVDATSGAGQIKVDFSKVDLYFFSPQKVFAGEGGFYLAIMSPKALARAKDLYQRTNYRPQTMRWDYAIDNSLKNQTYNTPSLSSLYLLSRQIDLMNELGEDEVIKQAKEKLQLITKWVDSKKYLNFFVKEEKFRSHSVATIDVDKKYSVEDLCKRLRELNVVSDIEAYRKLGRNQFRISLFHNISLEDLEKLTKIISHAFETVN